MRPLGVSSFVRAITMPVTTETHAQHGLSLSDPSGDHELHGL